LDNSLNLPAGWVQTHLGNIMHLNAPIEAFIRAVGTDGTTGLQHSLRAAWMLMTVEQKRAFLASGAVNDALKIAVAEDGSIDGELLTNHMDRTLSKMEGEIIKADYGIQKGAARGLVYWEYGGFASEDGKRPDIIVAAYEHLCGKKG
jgi:hypothetical protein